MSSSPNTTTGAASQMSCTVTNNLILPTNPYTSAQRGWNGEIVAISNTTGATIDASTETPQLFAASNFSLLSFQAEGPTSSGTTSPPGNPLAVGKTAGLSVSSNAAPTSGSVNNMPYDIVFVQANNYFPVATIANVAISPDSTDIVLPMAAPHNTSSAANAYRFLQAIMADPSSPMAQQFAASLSADANAEPVTGSCANVNSFFAQTNDFKNVDFAIYSAVSGYAFTYAHVWADFQPHFSYTIYTPTAADSADDGDPSASNIKLSPLGSVVFSQSDSCTPSLADANAGYSITWKPIGGSAVGLNFVEGQLVSQADGESSAICLQTAFMDWGVLTGKTAAATQPSQTLVGLINGIHVVGSPLQLDSPEPDDGENGKDELPSQDAADVEMNTTYIIILVCSIVAVLLLLSWIVYKTNQAWNEAARPLLEAAPVEGPPVKGPPREEIKRVKKKIREWDKTRLKRQGMAYKEKINKYPELRDRLRGGVDDSSDIFDMQVKEEGNLLTLEQAALERSQINEEKDEEFNQLQCGDNSAINSEVNQTNANRQELGKINLGSADSNQQLKTIEDAIGNNQSAIENQNRAMKINSPQQSQAAIKIAQQQQDAQKINEEENDEARESHNFQEET